MSSTLQSFDDIDNIDQVNVDFVHEGVGEGPVGMSQELTAAEAAARLGVKRETLYAYVSRGLLHRHMAMDGRTSLFDADEVESFRSGRRRPTEGELDTVISTSLTRVRDGDLRIRGRDLIAMVDDGATYEDVVGLLWDGGEDSWDPPGDGSAVAAAVREALPDDAPRIDRLGATVSAVSAADPLRADLSPGSVRAAGRGLIVAMVDALPLVGRSGASDSVAHRLWPRLTPRRPTEDRRRALDAALALLVDHGLAASTLGARVAASVRSDPYSVVLAGLGVVGGPLHGAASREVHELLAAADGPSGAAGAVGDAHRRLSRNPGFGHTIYRNEDPRYVALMRRVSEAWSDDPRLATVHAVRDLIGRRSDAVANVDLALGALTWLADMDADAGEAIFAVSRTAGWLAHALEEYGEQPLRFRPRARYIGERSHSG